MSDRWIADVREAFSIGWVRAISVDEYVKARRLSAEEKVLGVQLGFLPEESLAGEEGDSTRAAIDGDSMRRARLFWLGFTLSALADWWERNGDPALELPEVLSPWGDDAATVWGLIRPRGLDKLVFGKGARRRMIGRIRHFASLTSSGS